MIAKSNEIRIGNWLCHLHEESETPFQVTADDIKFLWEYENDINLDEHARFHGYGSIPLTEEWLLRLGYIKMYGEYVAPMQGHGSNLYDLRFFGDGIDLLISNKATHFPHIKHVHSFQNLYFALNGEELTLKS